MVLVPSQIDHIDNILKLKGYPKSRFLTVGYELHAAGHTDLAADAFLRGAKNDACVACMFFYAYCQYNRNNIHLALPWSFEAAIRGHSISTNRMIGLYDDTRPLVIFVLNDYWYKMRTELGDTQCTEESRKEVKKTNAHMCAFCRKEKSNFSSRTRKEKGKKRHKPKGHRVTDNNDVTFGKCGICKYVSYCGKNCQTRHWKEGKHMNECRQVILLRKYCKPSYVKEIREAIIGGQDPKEIHTLQRLRMKLGLNRPTEEYEELSLRPNDHNNITSRDRYEYLVGRKDGTVWIGSTPEAI